MFFKPTILSESVNRNIRYAYAQRFGHECIPLSDQLVFETWDKNGLAPSSEEQDDWTLDELHEFMGYHHAGIDLALVA